jgi:hypothetical protein
MQRALVSRSGELTLHTRCCVSVNEVLLRGFVDSLHRHRKGFFGGLGSLCAEDMPDRSLHGCGRRLVLDATDFVTLYALS